MSYDGGDTYDMDFMNAYQIKTFLLSYENYECDLQLDLHGNELENESKTE